MKEMSRKEMFKKVRELLKNPDRMVYVEHELNHVTFYSLNITLGTVNPLRVIGRIPKYKDGSFLPKDLGHSMKVEKEKVWKTVEVHQVGMRNQS